MLLNHKSKSKINIGDVAPDFELPCQNGKSIRLSDYRGRANVVLYFYPKDNTRGCIVESTSFRDEYEKFKQSEAEVLGVSSDSPASHIGFAQEFQLPFHLLSDMKNEVRKLYGVPSTLGLIPGRVTFVIDKAGIVRHKFSSQFDPKSHVKQALKALTQPVR